MVARLRDDAHVDELLEQRARELRALAVRDERIEAAQRGRRAERLREDLDLGALAQAAHAVGAFPGPVDVVENRDAHRADSSPRRGRRSTARRAGRSAPPPDPNSVRENRRHGRAPSKMAAMEQTQLPLDQDTCYAALLGRDADYDGVFYVGVRTTGIFCRPTCPARKPKRENCEFFADAQAALLAAYRPCARCRPLSHPNETSDVVRRLVEAVEREPLKRWRDADFDALAVHASTARRQFQKRFGMTFVEYARARRLGSAFKAIRSGERVIDAQLDAGFESPERLPRRVRADHGRAAREPHDARVVRRLARYAARADDGRRRRARAASARVRRPARPRARDRAAATPAEGRHRAGPHRADRADRKGAEGLFRRPLDDVRDAARARAARRSRTPSGTRC